MFKKLLLAAILLVGAPALSQTVTYDSAAGHSATASTISGSSLTITITMVAGETGVLCSAESSSNATITSITGGGTWTLQANPSVSSLETEEWMTTASGVTTAASITVNWSTALPYAAVVVGQYKNVGSIGTTTTTTGDNTAMAISSGIFDFSPPANSISISANGAYASNIPIQSVAPNSGNLELSEIEATIGRAAVALTDMNGMGSYTYNAVTFTQQSSGAFPNAVTNTPLIAAATPTGLTFGLLGVGN